MCVRSTYTLVYLSMQLERQTSWPLTPGKAECVVLSVTQHLINTEGARQFAFEHFATYQESCDRFCDCCARARQIRYSFRYLHPTNKSILSYSDTQCTFSNLLISISQFKWREECLCSAYTFHYCRSSAWWFVRQTRGNQHCEPLVFRCRSTNWLSGLLCCWREELIPTQKAPTRANAQIHTACCDTDVASVTMLHRNRCWQMHALEGALLHYGPSWLFLQFYIV